MENLKQKINSDLNAGLLRKFVKDYFTNARFDLITPE